MQVMEQFHSEDNHVLTLDLTTVMSTETSSFFNKYRSFSWRNFSRKCNKWYFYFVQLPVLNAWRAAHTLQTSLNYMQQQSTSKTCLRSASYTLHCFQNQKRKFFSALPSAIDENTKIKTWHLVTSRLKFMVFKGHAKLCKLNHFWEER
jgi:hypothetical protein